MADWVSDSDEEFEWDSDGDGEVAGSIDCAGMSAAASRNLDAPGPSTLAGPSSSSVENFVATGFEEKMVLRPMKDNGDGDEDSLVSFLLNYKAIGNEYDCSTSGSVPRAVDDEEDNDILGNWDDEDAGGSNNRVTNSDDSGDESSQYNVLFEEYSRTVLIPKRVT